MTATLPNGCPRSLAEQRLSLYDARVAHGYKNQVIAARQGLKITGMNAKELRSWLSETGSSAADTSVGERQGRQPVSLSEETT